jgi:hypothetical protein
MVHVVIETKQLPSKLKQIPKNLLQCALIIYKALATLVYEYSEGRNLNANDPLPLS